MGRFYQTSQANFIADKMMELPTDLMAKVITNTDTNIDGAIAEGTSLYGKLEAKGLLQDNPRLQQLLSGHEDSVDGMVAEIRKNPLEYQRKLGDIRKLARDIKTDFNTGEIGAIQTRQAADETWWSEAKKAQEKNPDLYTDEYLQKLRQKNLTDSGTVDFKGPSQYKQYAASNAMGLGSLNDWVEKTLKGAMPDSSKVARDTVRGGWIITEGTETRRMDEKELNDILQNALAADPTMAAALKQRGNIGMEGFSNLVGEDGNLLSSQVTNQEYEKEDGSRVTMPVLQFHDNILGNAFRAGVKKFGYEETSYTQSMKEDPKSARAQDLLNKQRMVEWEEKRQSDMIEYTGTKMLSNPGGSNIVDYTNALLATSGKALDLGDQVKEMLANELGGKVNIPNEAYNLISKGNFTALLDMENEDGSKMFNSTAIENLQAQYNSNKIEIAMLQGVRTTWENDLEKRYRGLTVNPKDHEQDFNNYLASRDKISVDQKYTFEGTDITEKEVKNFQQSIHESGVLYASPLNLPQGTMARGDKGMVDISNYTINQLISEGIIQKNKIKEAYEETTPGEVDEDGNAISAASTKTSYRMVHGEGELNFDINKQSIAPTTSWDDDKTMKLGFMMNFNGKRVIAKIDGVTSTKLKNFNAKNMKVLNTNYLLTKMSGLDEFIIPNAAGAKIVNKNGNQYLMLPTNARVDGFETKDINKDAAARNLAIQLLN